MDNEKLIPVARALDLFPGPPTLSTVLRWAHEGAAGRKLRLTKCGGRYFVSQAAIDEFLQPEAEEVGSGS